MFWHSWQYSNSTISGLLSAPDYKLLNFFPNGACNTAGNMLTFSCFGAPTPIFWFCVFLQDPPYFNVRPGGEYRQEAGRELVIPCAASGDPDIPTITWRKVQYFDSLFFLFFKSWSCHCPVFPPRWGSRAGVSTTSSPAAAYSLSPSARKTTENGSVSPPMWSQASLPARESSSSVKTKQRNTNSGKTVLQIWICSSLMRTSWQHLV